MINRNLIAFHDQLPQVGRHPRIQLIQHFLKSINLRLIDYPLYRHFSDLALKYYTDIYASNNGLIGYSKASFIATKASTASRPSMMR